MATTPKYIKCVCDDPRWMRTGTADNKTRDPIICCVSCRHVWKSRLNVVVSVPRAPKDWESMDREKLRDKIPMMDCRGYVNMHQRKRASRPYMAGI